MDRLPEIPKDWIAESLDKAEAFTNTVLPILRLAYPSAKEVMVPPFGAAACHEAETQSFPTVLRLRTHQFIARHNLDALRTGKAPIRSKNIRNSALNLQYIEAEMRLLRRSRLFPTQRTGFYQGQLIEQEQYHRHFATKRLFEIPPPHLNTLAFHVAKGYDLDYIRLVVTNGFGPDGYINIVGERRVEVSALGDISQVATFRVEDAGSLLKDDTLYLGSQEALGAVQNDPYDGDDGAPPIVETSEQSEAGPGVLDADGAEKDRE